MFTVFIYPCFLLYKIQLTRRCIHVSSTAQAAFYSRIFSKFEAFSDKHTTQSPNMSEETNFSALLDLNSYLNCITLLTDQ